MVGRRPGARPSSGVPEQQHRVVIPKLNKDPIWSLQPWPLVIELKAHEYEIPAMSAVEWLAYLLQPRPDLDGMIMNFFPDLDELLITGQVALEEVYEILLDVISTVTARPWWVTLRLISVVYQSWHVLGPIMLKAVDASQMSIAGWLDVLTVEVLNAMDPKDTTMFTSKLESPPPSERPEEPMEEMEMDRSAFLSMA